MTKVIYRKLYFDLLFLRSKSPHDREAQQQLTSGWSRQLRITFSTTDTKQRTEWRWGETIKLSNPAINDQLPPAGGIHLLQIPQSPQTVQPTRDQVKKYLSLSETLLTQTTMKDNKSQVDPRRGRAWKSTEGMKGYLKTAGRGMTRGRGTGLQHWSSLPERGVILLSVAVMKCQQKQLGEMIYIDIYPNQYPTLNSRKNRVRSMEESCLFTGLPFSLLNLHPSFLPS